MEEALNSKLEELGINVQTIVHAAAPTVEEHSKHVGHIEGAGQAKNLCLKDKKGNMYLISALKDTATDMKEISERLGVPKSAPLRMAAADKMQETLQVLPGAVTPFGVLSPNALRVRLLLDVRFKECKTLLFHPFVNTKTTCISPADFEKLLSAIGRTAEYVDFSSDSSLAKAPAGNGMSEEPSSPAAKPAKEPTPQKVKAVPAQAQEKQSPKKPSTPPRATATSEAAPPSSHVQAKPTFAAMPQGHELTSDEWASGKYGRPAGELVTKPWSQTMFKKPNGWNDVLELPDTCARAAGPLKTVDWSNSIFQKPIGW